MIFVLLPVYNEESNIGKLLDKFAAIQSLGDFRIILVNDGSKDRSKEIIETYKTRLSVTLINHDKNKGVTEALKNGIKEIVKSLKPNDMLITMDSDNTHDPGLIREFIEKFRQGYEIVNGSRFCKGGKMVGVPRYRLFFSYACKFILIKIFPMGNILDYSCFYRGYKGSLIQKMVDFYGDNLLQTQGFVGMPELLIKSSRFKPHAVEVPLIARYDLKAGVSKMKLSRTIRDYLFMMYLLKKSGL